MRTEVNDPFVLAAIRKLFDPTKHFSIITFDEICRVLNVIPMPGVRDRLSLLHCVNYRDMEPELRQELGRLVMETLSTPGFSIELRLQAPKPLALLVTQKGSA